MSWAARQVLLWFGLALMTACSKQQFARWQQTGSVVRTRSLHVGVRAAVACSERECEGAGITVQVAVP